VKGALDGEAARVLCATWLLRVQRSTRGLETDDIADCAGVIAASCAGVMVAEAHLDAHAGFVEGFNFAIDVLLAVQADPLGDPSAAVAEARRAAIESLAAMRELVRPDAVIDAAAAIARAAKDRSS
jgi:hypothetical protein